MVSHRALGNLIEDHRAEEVALGIATIEKLRHRKVPIDHIDSLSDTITYLASELVREVLDGKRAQVDVSFVHRITNCSFLYGFHK